MHNTGRLPKPSSAPSARVQVALRTYARVETARTLRRRRILQARLTMLIEKLTKPELAHYYAGVRAQLEAGPDSRLQGRVHRGINQDLFGRPSLADDGRRSSFDYYPTPAWMVRSLVHYHGTIRGTRVLECCSGDDAIARVLREYDCTVFTNDLDARHPALTHFDAAEVDYWLHHAPEVDWVITNAPFDVAFPILQCAVQHARVGVAFLLRKTFLEPTLDRGPWLSCHPPCRIIGQPRYNFRGVGSSDSVSCDWHIWQHRPDNYLPPIVVDATAERRR